MRGKKGKTRKDKNFEAEERNKARKWNKQTKPLCKKYLKLKEKGT